jgi:hypothetical protein
VKRHSIKVSLALCLLLLSVVGINAFHATAQTTTSTLSTATGISIPLAIDPINPAAIPLGDGNVSATPKVGYVDSCQTTFPSSAGAQVVGPWINTTSKTWDSQTKISVEGSVSWPQASYSVTISGDERIIMGNDEPIDHTTGIFPISQSDPAYQYDRNPNSIEPQSVDIVLPVTPTLAATPRCLTGGPIGILNDGVYLFDALDAEGRDAGAHEVLDSCQGHPDAGDTYHHHQVPSCIMDNDTTPNSSTLVGYAMDGFGIYVERDANGNLLTNANLDACHGRTSEVTWDGKLVDMYHYDATLEYPYTVGCFMGTVGSVTATTTSTSTSASPPTTSASTSISTSTSSSVLTAVSTSMTSVASDSTTTVTKTSVSTYPTTSTATSPATITQTVSSTTTRAAAGLPVTSLIAGLAAICAIVIVASLAFLANRQRKKLARVRVSDFAVCGQHTSTPASSWTWASAE